MTSNILKFRTIAVATDLSDPASAALRYAQAMARMYKAILVVVHVIDPLAYAFPEGAPWYVTANQSAIAELRKIEEETSALGIPVHSVIESGIVCDRILQALKDYNIDLLVLGTRAKGEAGRVALGTVARQLLAKSRCPILTVSPEAAKTLPGWLLGPRSCGNGFLACFHPSPALRASGCPKAVDSSACTGMRKRGWVPGAIALSAPLMNPTPFLWSMLLRRATRRNGSSSTPRNSPRT